MDHRARWSASSVGWFVLVGVLLWAFEWTLPRARAADDPAVFINEIHYDNAGGDEGEFIEIAGPAGTDLSGWRLVLYNGDSGAPYATIALTGVLPDQQSGAGTLYFAHSGIQNGAPDGLALVNGDNNVVQFLSYEGTFTAVGGPADGMTSSDIGVAETGSTAVGHSLQLAGTGCTYADFAWTGPLTATANQINAGQVFDCAGSETETTTPETATATTIPSATATPTTPSGWIINEIHADPDPDFGDANGDGDIDSDDDEFIEIVNDTGVLADLTGWTISDTVQIRFTFPAGTLLAPGCAVVVFGGGAPTGDFGGATVLTASSLGLNNAGDTVFFRNGAGTLAEYTYGSEGGRNQSLVRVPDVTGAEPLLLHSENAPAGARFSPGVRSNGDPFSGCSLPTQTATPTTILSATETATQTATPTTILSTTGTPSATSTPSATAMATATFTATATPTASVTATETITPSATPSATPAHTATTTWTATVTPILPPLTATPSATPTTFETATPTWTPAPTATPLATSTPTFTATPPFTATPTPSWTPSATETPSATMTPTATTVNRAPAAVDDEVVTDEDTPIQFNLLRNDVDEDGDALQLVTLGPVTLGTVRGSADGTIVYSPLPNVHGEDRFRYALRDGRGGASSAEVRVTIRPVNDAPVLAAVADQFHSLGEAVTLDLSAQDVDDDELTFSATGLPPGLSLDAGNGQIRGVVAIAGAFSAIVSVDDGSETASRSFTWFVESPTGQTGSLVYLPSVAQSRAQPDLVGEIRLDPDKTNFVAGEGVRVLATVRNIGTGDSGPFWVDLHINPAQPPLGPPAPWHENCGMVPCFGLAWTVAGLAAGETIELTSDAPSTAYSIWPGSFAGGVTELYLVVDSWGSATGLVDESNEADNVVAVLGLVVEGEIVHPVGWELDESGVGIGREREKMSKE